jgi:hypothetical protein
MGRKFLLLLAGIAFKWGLRKLTEEIQPKTPPPVKKVVRLRKPYTTH